MVRQPGLFDVEERLRELSAKGHDLERIAALVDFAQSWLTVGTGLLSRRRPC
jgi:hypothetical protein